VAEVCSAGGRTCARLADGGVRCWNDFGDRPVAIGEGAAHLFCGSNASEMCWTDAAHEAHCAVDGKPLQLPESKNIAAIQFAWDHACLLRLDGTVACWGKNVYGQLGTGKAMPERKPVPIRPLALPLQEVVPLKGVKALELGSQRTAAILADDGLATWGYGSIGDGRDCSGPPCDGLVPTQIPLP
jgi:alpha-tubulin suppressor-like RCC1 family protein